MSEVITEVLSQITAPGTFASRLRMPAESLEVEVTGVGPIRFPITARSAQKLCAVARPSPFGLREQTLHDLSVRNTWEVAASSGKDRSISLLQRRGHLGVGGALRELALPIRDSLFVACGEDSDKSDLGVDVCDASLESDAACNSQTRAVNDTDIEGGCCFLHYDPSVQRAAWRAGCRAVRSTGRAVHARTGWGGLGLEALDHRRSVTRRPRRVAPADWRGHGQNPRPLHANATSWLCLHDAQHRRAKPRHNSPHSRRGFELFARVLDYAYVERAVVDSAVECLEVVAYDLIECSVFRMTTLVRVSVFAACGDSTHAGALARAPCRPWRCCGFASLSGPVTWRPSPHVRRPPSAVARRLTTMAARAICERV